MNRHPTAPASRPSVPGHAMRLRAICCYLFLPFVLAACGGGGSSGGGGGGGIGGGGGGTVPPVETLPRGISVLAGAAGGEGNADGPVGRLSDPKALAMAADGVLYVGNFGATVRSVAPGTDGTMTVGTRWKGPDAPVGLVADAAGNLVGIIGKRIVRIAPDGTQSTLAGGDDAASVDGPGAQARFLQPVALAIDGAGLIYVADAASIRTVTAGGVVATYRAATDALTDVSEGMNGFPIRISHQPTGVAIDNAGNLVIGLADVPARKITPAGVRQDTTLTAKTAIAADRAGNLYGFSACTVYKADAAGHVSVLAGAPDRRGPVDGPGTVASFGISDFCDGRITTDAAGNVFVTDSINNTVRKVTADGSVATVAGKARQIGATDGAGTAARFDGGSDLTFDGKDNLYLVQANKVRKVTRAGVVTTLNLPEKDAGQYPITYFTGGMAYQGSLVGVANRVVYLVDESGSLRMLAGAPGAPRAADGKGAEAGFEDICGVTRDGSGNFYLDDCYVHDSTSGTGPDLLESRIRKVTPAGVVTTLYTMPAGDNTRQPRNIVADRQGNVFATNESKSVLKIAPSGATSSIPVDLQYPGHLAVDDGGNLFLGADFPQPAILEKIGPDGQAQLIAGRRDQYGLITGALPGSLNVFSGLAVDDKGTLYGLMENAIVRIVR